MRALLVLGGSEIPFIDYAKESDVIICSDSGADHAARQSIKPDVILGDMDSIEPETLEKYKSEGVKVITYPAEKDKTDGEISIDYAAEHNVAYITLVCAEGSLDHYLGNLYLLIYAKNLGVSAELITRDMTVFAVSSEVELRGKKGDRVSVMPAIGDIVVEGTQGLYYEIEKPLSIAFGQTIGLGNNMTGSICRISMKEGTAFVFKENEKT